MNGLTLLSGLIKLTLWFINYLEKRKIIAEAEASVLRRMQEDTDARLKKVADARNNVTDGDGLRDDDGHKRD